MSRPLRISRGPVRRRRDTGIVLVVVLFFALLLATTVATFARKALVDHMIVRNRDARAEAEALARGGVQLATALILEDALRASQAESALDHRGEPWAQAAQQPMQIAEGVELRLEIEDAGSRLNLNAAVAFDESGFPQEQSEQLLIALLEKAIEEIPLPPGERVYDPLELASNLIDYIDTDTESLRGGPEDTPYQQRTPPARPANQPLLSVDELRRVEGFDGLLVDALRPYVTVHPYAGGGGINPNTAPPHVLALLFFNDGVDLRLAPEDTVREILRVRRDEGLLCEEQASAEGCTPMTELVTNAIFPEPSYSSDVFIVTARARVGEIERRVEAVIDRRKPSSPQLLSWRIL